MGVKDEAAAKAKKLQQEVEQSSDMYTKIMNMYQKVEPVNGANIAENIATFLSTATETELNNLNWFNFNSPGKVRFRTNLSVEEKTEINKLAGLNKFSGVKSGGSYVAIDDTGINANFELISRTTIVENDRTKDGRFLANLFFTFSGKVKKLGYKVDTEGKFQIDAIKTKEVNSFTLKVNTFEYENADTLKVGNFVKIATNSEGFLQAFSLVEEPKEVQEAEEAQEGTI